MKQIMQLSMMIICVAALSGCNGKTEPSKHVQITVPNAAESNQLPSPESAPLPDDSFEIVGKVTYKSIEGGFYAIDGDDGSKYDPINLPESFKKDGQKVKLTARRQKDAMNLHMYGEIIEVVNIEAR